MGALWPRAEQGYFDLRIFYLLCKQIVHSSRAEAVMRYNKMALGNRVTPLFRPDHMVNDYIFKKYHLAAII